MKRIAMTLAVLSSTMFAAGPAPAGDPYYYQPYPVGYPAPYQQNNHETLKKVIIGGALVGLGFLAGRLTAPRNDYAPQFVQPPVGYQHGGYYRPQINANYHPQFRAPQHRSAGYRGTNGFNSHRF